MCVRARARGVVRMRQCACVNACLRSVRSLGNHLCNIHSEEGRQQHPFLAELETARTRASAALPPPPPPPPRKYSTGASSLPNVGILRNVKMVRHICTVCVHVCVHARVCPRMCACMRATYAASKRVRHTCGCMCRELICESVHGNARKHQRVQMRTQATTNVPQMCNPQPQMYHKCVNPSVLLLYHELQVLIVRSDLKMTPGKVASQVRSL